MNDEDEKTLEQKRAAHALQCVKEDVSGNAEEDYRRNARSLAATIVNNGLGQACATLVSKSDGDDGHRKIYDHLGQWLTSEDYASPYSGQGDLLDAITSHGQSEYVHAQSEALAWLEWNKKFAQAFLEGGDRE